MGGHKALYAAFIVVAFLIAAACSTPTPTGSQRALGVVDEDSQKSVRHALATYNINQSTGALRPGDLVRVKFTLAPELDTDQRVLPSGRLSLPYIGLIDVNIKDIESLTEELRDAYAAHLNQPDLSVTVLEYARPLPVPKIYVVGAVRQAGAFEIDAPITFIEALALAGGPDERADRNALAVIRVDNGEFVASFFQSKTILTAKSEHPAMIGFLMPGDIVFVPQTGLSSAAEISRQVQQLIGFSGYSGSFGYRFREVNE